MVVGNLSHTSSITFAPSSESNFGKANSIVLLSPLLLVTFSIMTPKTDGNHLRNFNL
jgi:hypothetical protein